MLICSFSLNNNKRIFCWTMTMINLFYFVKQWQALLKIYRYRILPNLIIFSPMLLMVQLYIFFKVIDYNSLPLLEIPDCISKDFHLHIEFVSSTFSFLYKFFILKLWKSCQHLHHRNFDGLGEIISAICVRYGCICSERSINIHSRFW